MSVGKDTVLNLAGALAPAVFTLITVPLYLHQIGAERFGVLAIAWTIVAALGFASLGMGPAVVYHLSSRHQATADARSSLVWTALLIGLVASVVGAAFVFGMAELYFRSFFEAPTDIGLEMRRAVPVLAGLLPLTIVTGILNGALQGSRRFAALNAVMILNAALGAFTPLAVALLISVEIKDLILATLAASAFTVVVQLAICRVLVPLRLSGRVRKSDAKALLGYGAWMSGTAFVAPLVLLLDRFVIGALCGPVAVAAYVLPYNFVQQLLLVPASLGNAILPRLATLPEDEVRQLQSSTLHLLGGLLTPLAVVAIAVAWPFFHVWIGPALAATAGPVAAILLVGAWLHGIAHVPSIILMGRNRPQVVTKLLFGCLIPYVAALYLATLNFGVIGAAVVWSSRAAFDLILFVFTRPDASNLKSLASSFGLVLSAAIVAVSLPWISEWYWGMMFVIGLAAWSQHRKVLISSAVRAFSAALSLSGRSLTDDRS